jgi:cytochrome c peroxidase
MHDGSLPTLEAVVAYYDRGGNANPQLDSELHALRLSSDEKRNLVQFLRALSTPLGKLGDTEKEQEAAESAHKQE